MVLFFQLSQSIKNMVNLAYFVPNTNTMYMYNLLFLKNNREQQHFILFHLKMYIFSYHKYHIIHFIIFDNFMHSNPVWILHMRK